MKKTRKDDPRFPPPIAVEGHGQPVVVVGGAVDKATLDRWSALAKSFREHPDEKQAFAVDFASLTLIRLDHIMRTTASPKTVQDCARIGKDFVQFAFHKAKD